MSRVSGRRQQGADNHGGWQPDLLVCVIASASMLPGSTQKKARSVSPAVERQLHTSTPVVVTAKPNLEEEKVVLVLRFVNKSF